MPDDRLERNSAPPSTRQLARRTARPLDALGRHERPLVSFLTSLVVHAALVVALGLIWFAVPAGSEALIVLSAGASDGDAAADSDVNTPDPTVSPSITADPSPQANDPHQQQFAAAPQPIEPQAFIPELVPDHSPAVSANGAANPGGDPRMTARVAPQAVDVTGALRGRGDAERRAILAAQPDGEKIENAVQGGLRWIAAHQSKDGGWRFDHSHGGRCRGECGNPGTHGSTTAATSLALLAFLGNGQTHLQGDYREEVRRGLYYLSSRAVETPHGFDFQEGTMYAQALATIALCEAYALSREDDLADYARGAVDFVVAAQDPKGGGWRYFPGQPGDITVTGWHIMALKCAQMAYIPVSQQPFAGAVRFLDSTAFESDAHYRYQPNDEAKVDSTRTAIGLLCRMYTGWDRDQPGLVRGIPYLDSIGPSPSDMYYNYYATQVMHHWGGEEWRRWDYRMRDLLIATQGDRGHESGSWHFPDKNGDKGGRLYNTALAVMTLEVYYRYLPLYEDEAVNGNF